MKYRSKPVEVEARRWQTGGPHMYAMAQNIVNWVKEHGGEARYQYSAKPETLGRIAVRTINGWAHADAGHYIVMGTVRFPDKEVGGDAPRVLRDFYPCDPETFEARWEAVAEVTA